MPDEDACMWSAAEVAAYIRDGLRRDIEWIPHVGGFDVEVLATQFENDDVNGHALLDAIDKNTLKDEYGIKSMAVRSAISRAVTDLRNKSQLLAQSRNGLQPSISQASHNDERLALATDGTTRPRGAEYLAEDGSGRKRRKLNLSAPMASATSSALHPVPSSANIPTSNLNPPSTVTTAQTTRTITSAHAPSTSSAGFLPDKAMKVDETFYGKTAMGDEVVLELSEDDGNFSIVGGLSALPGERLVVYKRLVRMMKASTEETVFRGRPALVRRNYPDRLALEGEPVSATVVYQGADDQAVAVRANADMLQFEKQGSVMHENFKGTQYEHLLHRWSNLKHDPVLPLLGESSESDTSSQKNEMEEDRLEDAQQQQEPPKVAPSRVIEILDEEIHLINENWEAKKLPMLEKKKAWSVWKQTRGKKSMLEHLLNGVQQTVDHLQSRLDALTAQFRKNQWDNEKELRDECESLEVTVEDIAEKNWEIEVLQRREEPTRVTKPRKSNNMANTSAAKAGHEDQLLDDFLEADSDEGLIEDDDLDLVYRDSSVQAQLLDDAEGGADNAVEAMDEQEDVSSEEQLPALEDKQEDSDDDLPSPSKFTEQLRATQLAREEARVPHEVTIISSDPPEPEPEPQLPIELSPRSLMRNRERLRQILHDPLAATDDEIKAWDWEYLEEEQLKNATLAKMVQEMDPAVVSVLRPYFNRESPSVVFKDLEIAIQTYPDEPGMFTGKTSKTSLAIRYSARLYVCWLLADRQFWDLEAQELAHESIQDAKWEESELRKWHSILKGSLHKADGMVIDIDDSDDMRDDDSDNVSQSQRKKKVAKNKESKNLRDAALARAAMSQQSSGLGKLPQMISGGDNTGGNIAIWAPESVDPSQHVYLNKGLAARLKPHQVEGVRFMWRELTVPDDENGQGCILAHTMGLGKTAQAIALLVTMAETVATPCKRNLIPQSLLEGKVLVLCPPSLIENWRQELLQWDPRRILGGIYSVDSTVADKATRLEALRSWSRFGGVMIIGYTMFRTMTERALTKLDPKDEKDANPVESATRANRLTSEEREETSNILLKRTSLVIADEAHTLRNETSKTSIDASQIVTHRRLALTGSPMSNNTREIYAVISWVAPKYLGSAQEFHASFVGPIEAGNYLESNAQEKRKSMMKLAALRRIIEPKLNRADITVLKGSIKPKVEFVLTVPLTELQSTAYKKFVDCLLSEKTKASIGEITQAKFFGWLAVLTLLTNHPWMFRRKLKEEKGKSKAKPKKMAYQRLREQKLMECGITSGSAESPSPADIPGNLEPVEAHVSAMGIREDMANEICAGLSDRWSVEGSYKTLMVEKILDLSVKAGDKLLLFSHNLPSLDFLSRLLQKMKLRYACIDGSVTLKNRTAIMERMERGDYDVLLISTKAGGQGLNIQSANRVIIFDFGFNPVWEEQAIGRAYRIGQTKPVFVYRFVAGGTFENKLYERAIFKTGLASKVVDKMNPMRIAQRNMEDWLQEPKSVAQSDILSEMGKDPDVLDKILAEHATEDCFIRAIKTMETLQQDAGDAELDEAEKREVERDIAQTLMMMKKYPAASMDAASAGQGTRGAPKKVYPAPAYTAGLSAQDMAKHAPSGPSYTAGIHGYPEDEYETDYSS